MWRTGQEINQLSCRHCLYMYDKRYNRIQYKEEPLVYFISSLWYFYACFRYFFPDLQAIISAWLNKNSFAYPSPFSRVSLSWRRLFLHIRVNFHHMNWMEMILLRSDNPQHIHTNINANQSLSVRWRVWWSDECLLVTILLLHFISSRQAQRQTLSCKHIFL